MKFISKRNQVSLEKGIIIKRFGDEGALLREMQALQDLGRAGLAVPALLGRRGNALLLQYIAGETYADLVEGLAGQEAQALARWLLKYHELTGLLRGDVNLRNFLWYQESCYGVDFEDLPTSGDREVDMGRMIAFAVTYRPSFSPGKAHAARLLLKVFLETGGRQEKIKAAYLEELMAMQKRRRAKLDLAKAALFFPPGGL